MPIRVICSCGAKLKAPDDCAGRTLTCPKCGGPFLVEATELDLPVVEPPRAAASITPPPDPPSYKPSPRRAGAPPVETISRATVPSRVAIRLLPLLVLPAFWLAFIVWTSARTRPVESDAKSTQELSDAPDRETDIQRGFREAREEVARIKRAQQTGDYTGVSNGMNPNHPDYGGMIWLALIEQAGKKVVPGRGLKWWMDHLTDEQRDAVLLNTVKCGIGSRGIEDLVRRGWADRIPHLIDLLNTDVATSSATVVSASLEDILKVVRLPQEFDESHEPRGLWLVDDDEKMDAFLETVNKPLEPIEEDFDKDIDHYFYRRWIKSGRGSDWLDWE